MKLNKLDKTALVLLTVLILGTSLSAQTNAPNDYEQFLKTGKDQLKAGDYKAACDSFERAVHYNDSASDGHLGLGMAYFYLRKDAKAEYELNKVIELNSNSSEAHALLGELYYRKDDFEKAEAHWEKAIELNPSNDGLRAILDRIKREHRIEKDFNREVTSHFFVKYEGNEKIEAGKIVLRILEEAYGVVGRGLSYYPARTSR